MTHFRKFLATGHAPTLFAAFLYFAFSCCTWVLNGAIYLFKTALLFDPIDPSLYGDRVAAYPMTPPYGHNIDDPTEWAVAEGMLSGLA